MKKKLEIGKTYVTIGGSIRTVHSIDKDGDTIFYENCTNTEILDYGEVDGLYPFSLSLQQQRLDKGYLTEYNESETT